MKTIGIICEYNPFHNGHLYHIKKIKELFPDSTIICVMSGNYVERGEVSVLNKWDKTKIALEYGIDLIVELPFAFSSQSADLFCRGSIQILNALKVDGMVFGSEINNLEILKKIAQLQLTQAYNEEIKKEIQKGNNYPSACMKTLKRFTNIPSLGPNDTLGIGYLRELILQKSSIIPYTIQRTNDYHSMNLDGSIASATAVRSLLKEGKDVSHYIPYSIKGLQLHFNEDYFSYLKYKILSERDLTRYQSVEEGIENRIKKKIMEANSFDELVHKVKTKRYTYHNLSRMFLHILVGFTKEEAKNMKEIEYIRVLGFNDLGKEYLKKKKAEFSIPIFSRYKNHPMLELEQRASLIYDGSLEHKKRPIIKR